MLRVIDDDKWLNVDDGQMTCHAKTAILSMTKLILNDVVQQGQTTFLIWQKNLNKTDWACH